MIIQLFPCYCIKCSFHINANLSIVNSLCAFFKMLSVIYLFSNVYIAEWTIVEIKLDP